MHCICKFYTNCISTKVIFLCGRSMYCAFECQFALDVIFLTLNKEFVSWFFEHLTRMSKASHFPSKKFKECFSIQLHLLPQLPPSNLRQLLALQSPKAKMPRVHRVPLPQRLSLAEESVLHCLPLPLPLPHQNRPLLPPLCHLCHLP